MKSNNLNTYIFTTKYVVTENSPVVRVLHDNDGDWQFLGKEDNLTEADAMVLSFEEIIQLDKSLLKIIDLPINKEARRNNIEDTWEIYDID